MSERKAWILEGVVDNDDSKIGHDDWYDWLTQLLRTRHGMPIRITVEELPETEWKE